MQIYLDCLPCCLRQTLEASRIATKDSNVQKKIMQNVLEVLLKYEKYRNSPELGREIHNIVKKYTGELDPYKDIKAKSIKAAKDIYPYLKDFLDRKQGDRLYWALKIAATGNVIDYAIDIDIDIEESVKKEIEKEFTICDIDKLEKKMKNAKNILILGDNAGETVFDKVLIEELEGFEVTYAVRSEPIINDATYEDACESGLDQCSRIVSTGCNAPGVILEEGSSDFIEVFENADIIISKGQGNYETLSDIKQEIFFLLKVKCPALSHMIGVNINDYVFKFNS